MKPHCHNRPERVGIWLRVGRVKRGKRVLRWVPIWFLDRCAAWDSGPSPISESVPAREKWRCDGCRWLPVEAGKYLQEVG
jgi:hypothetical protein